MIGANKHVPCPGFNIHMCFDLVFFIVAELNFYRQLKKTILLFIENHQENDGVT